LSPYRVGWLVGLVRDGYYTSAKDKIDVVEFMNYRPEAQSV
jgi:hypothetical protein